MENVRKHTDIKLVPTDEKRNQLISEPNYHTTKYFPENLMEIEMKQIKVKVNKRVCVGMSILDISKILMFEFWYDYINSKYQDRGKLCYIDTETVIIDIKTEDFYENIANNVEKHFDTPNYDIDDKRPLLIDKKQQKRKFYERICWI